MLGNEIFKTIPSLQDLDWWIKRYDLMNLGAETGLTLRKFFKSSLFFWFEVEGERKMCLKGFLFV